MKYLTLLMFSCMMMLHANADAAPLKYPAKSLIADSHEMGNGNGDSASESNGECCGCWGVKAKRCPDCKVIKNDCGCKAKKCCERKCKPRKCCERKCCKPRCERKCCKPRKCCWSFCDFSLCNMFKCRCCNGEGNGDK